MRNVPDKCCIEYEKHILHSTTPPSPENGAVCEMNVEKFGISRRATDGDIVQDMSFSCRESECCRHTKIIYNTYCFATTTVVTRTRLNSTFIHTLPLLIKYLLKSFKVMI